MAITQAMARSFKGELFQGLHQFVSVTLTSNRGGTTTPTADTFKIALYTSAATLDQTTTVYTTTNETTNTAGTAYTAGGQALVGATMSNTTNTSGGVGCGFLSFTDVTWATASITANGAMIYNSTQQVGGFGRTVAILAFGGDKTSTAGNFTIQFPAADANSAIIRIA